MSHIHENFILQAATRKKRVVLAEEMGKTISEIESLTSYHDLMRIPSINKHIAKIYFVSGITSVKKLQTLTSGEIMRKISRSTLGKDVYIHKETIEETIEQSQNLLLLVEDLERIQYLTSPQTITTVEEKTKKSGKISDFIVFMVTIFILLLCSTISWYFLALIPIIISIHVLVGSEFVNGLKYKGLEIITAKLAAVIFSAIFFFGILFGNVMGNVQSSYDYVVGNTFSVPVSQFYPDEIHSLYKNREISREELIKLLVLAREVDVENLIEKECFEDSFTASFPLEICYARSQGYVQGDANGNFLPNETINHGAGLKFILNFYDYDVPRRSLFLTYDDLEKDQWYTTYAEYAKRMGLIPKSMTHFGATESITIEQIDRYVQVLSIRENN